MNNNSTIYREMWVMAPLFKWIDKHPRLANTILWMEGMVMLYVIFTYNFTTNP